MNIFDKTPYQRNQIAVINKIEAEVKLGEPSFSTVSPVKDYGSDQRMCLTGVHLPDLNLLETVSEKLINPLRKISPGHYYYPESTLHLTVKNVRVISDPPNFTPNDVARAKKVFSEVVPRHKKYQVYFYRLLLFKSNLSLIGTTDEELDRIVMDLDRELKRSGVPDDKVYANTKYFFSNMTLVRFTDRLSEEYLEKIDELSKTIAIAPYAVNSVTLLTSNAVLEDKRIIGKWNLE